VEGHGRRLTPSCRSVSGPCSATCTSLSTSRARTRGWQTFKIFHHLYDPKGETFVTKGPAASSPIHRGFFYGFNKVTYGEKKSCDVWHCTGDAFQSHEKFLLSEAGPVYGRHRLSVAWHGVGKEVFAQEERDLTVYSLAQRDDG